MVGPIFSTRDTKVPASVVVVVVVMWSTVSVRHAGNQCNFATALPQALSSRPSPSRCSRRRRLDADQADIPDDLWAALAAEYSEAQVLDLLLLAGWYHAICFVANSVRLRPEPGTPTFADHR